MTTKLLTDEEISRAFDASWATHGDRPTRFARIIEYELLNRIRARIPHTEETGEVCTDDCKGCEIVKTLGLNDEPEQRKEYHLKVFTQEHTPTSPLNLCGGRAEPIMGFTVTDKAAVEKVKGYVDAGYAGDLPLCPTCRAAFLANYDPSGAMV